MLHETLPQMSPCPGCRAGCTGRRGNEPGLSPGGQSVLGSHETIRLAPESEEVDAKARGERGEGVRGQRTRFSVAAWPSDLCDPCGNALQTRQQQTCVTQPIRITAVKGAGLPGRHTHLQGADHVHS